MYILLHTPLGTELVHGTLVAERLARKNLAGILREDNRQLGDAVFEVFALLGFGQLLEVGQMLRCRNHVLGIALVVRNLRSQLIRSAHLNLRDILPPGIEDGTDKVQTLLIVTYLPVRAVVLVLEVCGIVEVRILFHQIVQLHADTGALFLILRHIDVPKRCAYFQMLTEHIEEFW